MAISEAKRKSNKKYDDEHMSYQSVKVSKEVLAEFRETVQRNGDKVNTVLRQAMLDYIEKNKG